jgi:hypothetical protein
MAINIGKTPSCTALRLYDVVAPFLIRGPINRDRFETYVEKTPLRRANPRSEETINDEIAKFLKTITLSECANYFRNTRHRSA